MERENVKQNINFLEYPLWFQDEVSAANAEQGIVWKDREGFVYRAGYKSPVKTDAIFLLIFVDAKPNKWLWPRAYINSLSNS